MLILVALGLLGLRIRPGRLLLAGLGLGILTEVSRLLLFYAYLHTPVVLLGLVCVLVLGFRLSLRTAVTGCFLSFFLLRMGESLIAFPVLSWTKIPVQVTLANPWLHIGFGWLSAGFLVLAAVFSHLFGVTLVTAPEAQIDDQKG